MTEFAFPYRIDGRGRTADADEAAHVRQLIEQLLFTSPGERVNRPDFGSGLLQLVFAPSGPELAATTQFLVQAGLQQWLGDRIQVDDVSVTAVDSTITVVVQYTLLDTQDQHTAEFSRSV